MRSPLDTRLPALAVFIAGIACTAAACAQPGWHRGPGSGWDRGPYDGYYGMGPGMMGPGMMGPGWGRNMPAFDQFDRDGNGKISPDELDATRAERQSQRAAQGYPMRGAAYAPSFSDIDGDGNGSISPGELRKYHAARRGYGMGWR
jgi:hypothetical protein